MAVRTSPASPERDDKAQAAQKATARPEQPNSSDLAEAGLRINFAGKNIARELTRRVRPRVMTVVAKHSVGTNEEQSHNLVVEGDNLQSMVTLYRERGQLDLVVADPPYNTGNDFRYNDKWDEDPNDPGLGEFVSSDDGARHTKWMRFMWPRLQMMKSMLSRTGVLAICIDYRELFHLGQMLDELFGEHNRLAIINWQKMAGAKNQDQGVSTTTEYILVYARDLERARTGKTARSDETAGSYQNPDSDPNGAWAPSDSTLMGAPSHPGQVYAIQNPFTGRLHYPQQGRCWRNERAKMKAAVEEWGSDYEDVDLQDGLRPALVIKGVADPFNADVRVDPVIHRARERAIERRDRGAWPRFFWRADRQRRPGEGELRYKTYEEEVKAGVVPTTFWADDSFEPLELGSVSWIHEQSGTTHGGQRELNAILGRGHGFETVKPLMLMEKLIELWCPRDGLVLDPFAGSGTTGHAVMNLNSTTGSARRFILIEQGRPEKGDSYARTLLAERLKRAISGKWASGPMPPLQAGFRFVALKNKVDADAVLRMERDEMVDAVIGSYFDASKKRSSSLIYVNPTGYRYLVAKNGDDEGFFLVWDGPLKNTDFTVAVYEDVAREAKRAGLKPAYHIYARFNLYQTENVRFYQIPDRILADFGLDVRSEPFHELEG
jgi:adenine-specific DNA-methyltransferase